MFSWRAAALHLAAWALFGSLVVATPMPLNLAALVAWCFVVRRWAKRRSRPDRHPRINGVSVIQVLGMATIVLIAALAPVKIVDRQKSLQITLPKPVMTLAELADPVGHDLERFYHCYVSVPEGLADHAVRFPSRKLTVGEFIAAIEAQTPLRHRFRHCGNGTTILWGGDCSFGLHFDLPESSKPTPHFARLRPHPATTIRKASQSTINNSSICRLFFEWPSPDNRYNPHGDPRNLFDQACLRVLRLA